MKKVFTLIATLVCFSILANAQAVDNGEMIINFTNGSQVTYLIDKVVSITFNRTSQWTVQVPEEYAGNEVYLVIKDPSGDKKYRMDQEGTSSTYTVEHKASIGDEYTYSIKQSGSSEMCGVSKIFQVQAGYVMNDDISDERLDCEKASWSVIIPDANIGENVYLSIKKESGTEDYKMTQVGSTAEYITEQKAEVGDEYSYYIKGESFEKCVINRIFYVNDTYQMRDDVSNEILVCHAGISETEMLMNVGEVRQLFMYKDGEIVVATWSSADTKIAEVSTLGYVYAIREGTTVITGEYNGEKVYCTVTCKYISKDYRLNGSQYFVFMMGTETSKYISGRITGDFRPNGAYIDEDGHIMPENADCLLQIWNPSAEIEPWPNEGENSFGTDEEWFGTSAADPTPGGGWGNVCGGAKLTNNNGKFALFKQLTVNHVLLVSLKGNYSVEKPFKYGMKINGKEYWFLTVDRPTGVNQDGDWETFEIPLSKIGFDFGTDLNEKKDFFTFLFKADKPGNTVDIDAAFFYIPAAK